MNQSSMQFCFFTVPASVVKFETIIEYRIKRRIWRNISNLQHVKFSEQASLINLHCALILRRCRVFHISCDIPH
uniref:Uncharacterized protein n=1 Tax=Anguilla anguilla TaxID=7936 RepID=A0A0E9VJ33_ANGAN